MRRICSFFLLNLLAVFPLTAVSDKLTETEEVRQFIDEMVNEHQFDANRLIHLFEQAEISNSILKAISRPAEAKPWYEYRKIFVTRDRIRQGVRFLDENLEALEKAEKTYGVPVEIITAIIGVETRYGRHAGNYRVLNSLATLAFAYPKRAKFFRGELKEFLLLAREQELDPLEVKGSYAGAMGIPQFISSSYRHYAVDFDNDGKIDIWRNPVDAIGSVGNYFRKHGWQPGAIVAVDAEVSNESYLAIITKGLEPHLDISELHEYGITASYPSGAAGKVKFLEYELKDGREFWLGFENFYVITRYNHSALYAMAVYQLAMEIKNQYREDYEE